MEHRHGRTETKLSIDTFEHMQAYSHVQATTAISAFYFLYIHTFCNVLSVNNHVEKSHLKKQGKFTQGKEKQTYNKLFNDKKNKPAKR